MEMIQKYLMNRFSEAVRRWQGRNHEPGFSLGARSWPEIPTFRKGGRFLRFVLCSLRYAVMSLSPISATKRQMSRVKSLLGICRLSHLPVIEPRKREGNRTRESMRMG